MDASSAAPASYELSEYGVLLRRRWRIVAAGLLAGLLLPGLYLLIGPKTYTAETRVLVEPMRTQESTALENGISRAEVNLDTEAQIATSIVVAKRAQQKIGTRIPPQDLLEYHVGVTVPPNSAVLVIAYDASKPEAARAGAQAFAKAYLENRREQARSEVRRRVNALEKKLKSLSRQLDNLSGGTAGGPGSLSATRETVLTEQIATLSSHLSSLSTTAVTPGRIISAAQVPTSPSSPIVPLWLASGLMAGLLVGVTAAVLRDRGDTRIRDTGDVERLVKLPVLVSVPGKRQGQPALLPPRTRAGQAFHELSHSLSATLGYGNHIVLVTGASPGPGTSMVATNLAATLARTGSGTVLVCADLQSTMSTWMLGLDPAPGLSDILLHGTRVSAVEQRPIEPSRLRVIGAGQETEAATEQLQTHAMERLVGELRQSATYIVVEASSTSESADAQGLADLCDVAIVVVEVPRAEREQVREGVRRLDRVGAATLGAVVVPTLETPQALRQAGHMRQETAPAETMPRTAGPGTAPLRLSPEDIAAAKRGEDPLRHAGPASTTQRPSAAANGRQPGAGSPLPPDITPKPRRSGSETQGAARDAEPWSPAREAEHRGTGQEPGPALDTARPSGPAPDTGTAPGSTRTPDSTRAPGSTRTP